MVFSVDVTGSVGQFLVWGRESEFGRCEGVLGSEAIVYFEGHDRSQLLKGLLTGNILADVESLVVQEERMEPAVVNEQTFVFRSRAELKRGELLYYFPFNFKKNLGFFFKIEDAGYKPFLLSEDNDLFFMKTPAQRGKGQTYPYFLPNASREVSSFCLPVDSLGLEHPDFLLHDGQLVI